MKITLLRDEESLIKIVLLLTVLSSGCDTLVETNYEKKNDILFLSMGFVIFIKNHSYQEAF